MGRIPSYRLHKPSGRAVVTLAGRDYYLGVYGSAESKREYRKLTSSYLASGNNPSFGIKADQLTITELVASFHEHCKSYYGVAEKSEYWRFKPVMKSLKALFGPDKCLNFGPLELKALRADFSLPRTVKLKDGSETVITRSRKYVNKLVCRTLRIFKWATSEGMLPISSHQALKTVDPLKKGRCDLPERPKVKPISDEVIAATLPHLPPVLADMIKLQRLVGCRPGELCMLKPSLVDRSTEKTDGVWTVTLIDHKNEWRGQERVMYVGPQGQEILGRYLLRSADSYCFSPREAQKQRRPRSTPLSCGNKPGKSNFKPKTERTIGDHYQTTSYGNAIRKACVKAGIPPWSPNRIRHTAGTDLRKNFGVEAASMVLGHNNPDTTLIYAEGDRATLIKIVKAVG